MHTQIRLVKNLTFMILMIMIWMVISSGSTWAGVVSKKYKSIPITLTIKPTLDKSKLSKLTYSPVASIEELGHATKITTENGRGFSAIFSDRFDAITDDDLAAILDGFGSIISKSFEKSGVIAVVKNGELTESLKTDLETWLSDSGLVDDELVEDLIDSDLLTTFVESTMLESINIELLVDVGVLESAESSLESAQAMVAEMFAMASVGFTSRSRIGNAWVDKSSAGGITVEKWEYDIDGSSHSGDEYYVVEENGKKTTEKTRDKDTDNDGKQNKDDEDIDGDGIPNGEDDDRDGDGVPNDKDNYPNDGSRSITAESEGTMHLTVDVDSLIDTVTSTDDIMSELMNYLMVSVYPSLLKEYASTGKTSAFNLKVTKQQLTAATKLLSASLKAYYNASKETLTGMQIRSIQVKNLKVR